MKKIILAIFLLSSQLSIAQEIAAKVTVNFEALQIEYREKLINFATQIEDYINKNKWTDIKWEGPKSPFQFKFISEAVIHQIVILHKL